MKTVGEMLREADPVRLESAREVRRGEVRRVVLAAARDARPWPASSTWARPAMTAVIVVVLIVAAAVAGSRFWPGGSATLQAAVQFEVRLAQTTPAPGLHPIKVGKKTLYLDGKPVVTNDDISSASVMPFKDTRWYSITISLTARGAEKMRKATAGHMFQPMAILIDGHVVTAPVVKSIIGRQAVITGHYTKDEAERIANGVMVH